MVAAFGLVTKTSLSMLPARTHYTTLPYIIYHISKCNQEFLVPPFVKTEHTIVKVCGNILCSLRTLDSNHVSGFIRTTHSNALRTSVAK